MDIPKPEPIGPIVPTQGVAFVAFLVNYLQVKLIEQRRAQEGIGGA